MSRSPQVPQPVDGLSDAELLQQCRVETFRAGGPGGQHQNTTDSAVRLTHLPSGIRATSRVHRSQHRNKQEALRRLRERVARARERKKARIATRVPRREKRARLEGKRRRSEVKRQRKAPPSEEG